ncbi:MAG: carboxypeptidase regulatory-like domain-containing protein, partial [Candidatus Riflebacteria bacterium]|nr:carboxypeptidase regulatory-like domain-containing protein [Candidatus Riflebacteria bacterium]
NTIKESIKGLKAAIGKEVEVDKEYIIEKIDDYVYIASKSKLKGVVSPDGSLELILYYQKTLYYSVKYQDLDGNTISAASQYEKKYPCKIGDEITIKNHVISLDGYEFVKSDPDQESVTIEKDNLEIILHYQKKEVTPVISTGKYIIKRINYDTEIVISTSSEYEGDDGDTITVPNEFLSYEGYSFLESESEYTGLKIKAGETIVIELYFVALKETMTYTIEYYDTDNNSIRDADEVEDTIDAEIELSTENGNVPDIEGYKYLADKSTTTGKLEKGKELVLKLVYQKEYTISGKVTDSNNTPLSGATIQLFAASDPKTLIDTVKTDNSGSYKFIVYETGDYLLVISGSGYSPQTVTVKVPTTATRANIKL